MPPAVVGQKQPLADDCCLIAMAKLRCGSIN
jgi:hypothetical protein